MVFVSAEPYFVATDCAPACFLGREEKGKAQENIRQDPTKSPPTPQQQPARSNQQLTAGNQKKKTDRANTQQTDTMETAFMQEGTSVDKGENARLSSFVGAIAIADLVKTTLGPKGMDKILQSISPDNQGISVTNDGATILKSVQIDNAAAKVLVDIAKVQDSEVGDGTTSVAVFCGELL